MSLRVSILFFDMNSYFASVAQQEEPDLIGRPVGVLTTDAPGAACIAASYEAKAHGVRMGTRVREAQQICPGIVFRAAKHDVCVKYHHQIRAAVDKIIPIHAAHSVDEFSCHLMGREQELKTALGIARQVQQVILDDVGPAMRCSVGVAPSRLLAKLAAEMKKPAGINWLHPNVLPDRIAHIPLTDIPGISNGMAPRLEQAGITDVRKLYAMSPKQARYVWGNVVGERFIRELQGEQAMWPRNKGQSIGHGQQLTAGNKTPEGARLVARRLMVKAGARLRRDRKFAGRISVGAKCDVHGRQGKAGNIKATQNTLELLETFDRYWTGFRLARPRSVNVMLSGLTEERSFSGDLFDQPDADIRPNKQETLFHMIDQLNQRYGQDTVQVGELPPHKVAYTGAKIAFDRVPDEADFFE